MASGAWHYQRAEGLLENAWTHVGINGPLLHSAEVRLALVASAQVHATLALVAATVETGGLDTWEVEETGASGDTEWGKAVRS